MEVPAKPSSLEEAVEIVQASFPISELQAWAAQPEDEARLNAHFGLGLWVRSHWVYGDGSPLTDQIKANSIFIHEDDISSIVVMALWRVLNGAPCPVVEELLQPWQRHDE